MSIKTTLEQIEEVQAAITAVMTSQELDQPGNAGRLVRARLDALTDRETMLLSRYKGEQGYGLSFNTGIMRRD